MSAFRMCLWDWIMFSMDAATTLAFLISIIPNSFPFFFFHLFRYIILNKHSRVTRHHQPILTLLRLPATCLSHSRLQLLILPAFPSQSNHTRGTLTAIASSFALVAALLRR
ncbi:hypothetical protein RJT34_11975 [Clitoria ternatea]|uniref:Uncharacterized protein n=1 Tax=Clitoria ternatea TaxID=43366 RepID=A0AAN9PKI3_CLITE